MQTKKGYKVFNPDWTCSPNGNKKQYACPGIFETEGQLAICSNGIHFCENLIDCFNYYVFDPKNHVAEVIARGDIQERENKICTNRLEIVRELAWVEVLQLVNSGYYNSGKRNTGNYNTGDCNSGGCNTGNCNSGHRNSGHRNTGNHNTGHYNSGNHNTGNCNSGNCNTGHYNSGHRNTGNYNSGNCNVGDYNVGDCNIGCFNTVDSTISLFNQTSDWTYWEWLDSDARYLLEQCPRTTIRWIPSRDMTEKEKEEHPDYSTTKGYLKLETSESVQDWWDGLTKEEQNIIRSIPNFDAAIFEEATGIKVEQKEK